MVHIPEYSLVIRPPDPIINYVAALKKRLKDEIGWFGSANSLAHITVFNFDADGAELEIWKRKIDKFCETVDAKEVVFDHFNTFPPRTFYIAPSPESAQFIDKAITNFQQFIGVKPNSHAHMSIARGLDADRLERAKILFKHEKVNFSFDCDRFVLRKFNQQNKQYSDIIGAFRFGISTTF